MPSIFHYFGLILRFSNQAFECTMYKLTQVQFLHYIWKSLINTLITHM